MIFKKHGYFCNNDDTEYEKEAVTFRGALIRNFEVILDVERKVFAYKKTIIEISEDEFEFLNEICRTPRKTFLIQKYKNFNALINGIVEKIFLEVPYSYLLPVDEIISTVEMEFNDAIKEEPPKHPNKKITKKQKGASIEIENPNLPIIEKVKNELFYINESNFAFNISKEKTAILEFEPVPNELKQNNMLEEQIKHSEEIEKIVEEKIKKQFIEVEEKYKNMNSLRKLRLSKINEEIYIECEGCESTVKLSLTQSNIFQKIINKKGFVDNLVEEVSSKKDVSVKNKAKKDTVYSTVSSINTKINNTFGFQPINKEPNGPYVINFEVS